MFNIIYIYIKYTSLIIKYVYLYTIKRDQIRILKIETHF